MSANEILQIITAFIGSLGFALLYNIRGKKLFVAAIGGLLSWGFFIVLGWFIEDESVRYFIVALLLSLYAEIMARLLKTPTTTFIITSLIPLIPGSSLYYTMAYAFSRDSHNFIINGINTLRLAGALALGIIFATALSGILNKASKKN